MNETSNLTKALFVIGMAAVILSIVVALPQTLYWEAKTLWDTRTETDAGDILQLVLGYAASVLGLWAIGFGFHRTLATWKQPTSRKEESGRQSRLSPHALLWGVLAIQMAIVGGFAFAIIQRLLP